jgi:uncharacterized membrane protein
MIRWSFGFTSPVLIGGVAVIALATWLSIQQWRRSGATKTVLGLEILRWVIVAMLFVTLGRPELVHTVQPNEKPSVVVLADASRSMTTRDVVTADKSVLTRAEWIARQQEQNAWQPLAAKYNLFVEEFSPVPVTNTPAAASTNLVSTTPPEEGTDINAALEEVRARHKNLRAVVVLSDGDANLGRSAVGAATKLRMDRVPVYAVAVGSEKYLPDLVLENVQAPSYAMAGEQVFLPFTVQSYMPREVRTRAKVMGADGEVSSKELVIPPMGRLQESLFWTPMNEGTTDLKIVVENQEGELHADNNTQSFSVAVRREVLKVLVVDSLPRWEFRFLKNALSRDPGVEVKCVLLHPDMKAGGGRDYLAAFPSKPEELSVYDVVFLGDVGVARGELTEENARMIKGLVEQQGSGLVFMPGMRGQQLTLASSPLADLLPVQYDATRKNGIRADTPSRLILTRQGRGHLLTMLESTEDRNYALWKNLPGFTWNAPVEKSRPGSEVLAVHEVYRTQWGKVPLLVTRPAGNGKVLFMGTDAAWRWRRGVEDRYHYRFWGQVVRWMSYQRHLAQTDGYRALITPDNPRQGETVFLNVTVFDQFNSPLNGAKVTVDVAPQTGATERLTLKPVEGGWGMYQGQFVASQGGGYRLKFQCEESGRTMETRIEARGVQREQVGRPSRPETLREVAAITEGQLGDTANITKFIEAITRMPEPEPREQRLRIWCHPFWGGLIVLLLAVYWIGRKIAGLV